MISRLYRKFLLWLTNTKFYEHTLLHVIPYIRFTTYYTKMRGETFHNLYDLLEPGHIVLTIDKKKLTTILIPGTFSHAAFCVSKDKKWEMSEMTHTHYTKSTFADVCFQADRVMILECTEFDNEYRKSVIRKCKEFEGTPYDVKFQFGAKALSCSELIYESDYERRIGASIEDLVGLGTPYVSPEGLYRATNVKIIYDTDWEKKDEGEKS